MWYVIAAILALIDPSAMVLGFAIAFLIEVVLHPRPERRS